MLAVCRGTTRPIWSVSFCLFQPKGLVVLCATPMVSPETRQATLEDGVEVSCCVFADSVVVAVSKFDGIGTVLFVSESKSGGAPAISVKLGHLGEEGWALVAARQIYEVCDGRQLVLTLAIKGLDRDILSRIVELVRATVSEPTLRRSSEG